MAQKNLRETLRGIKAGAVTVTRDEPRVVPIREVNSGTVSENRDEQKDYLSKVRQTQDALAVQQNYKVRQPQTSYVEDAKNVMPRVESGLTLPAIDTFAASDITFRNRQRDAQTAAHKAHEDMISATGNHQAYKEAEERHNAALQDVKEAKSRVKANEGAKWMSDKAYQYSGLWKNDDYGEKSRADSEILKKGETAPDFSGFLGSKGANTNLYYNVNQGRNALLLDTEVIGGKAHAGLPAYAYMTDSEVRNFNYIYATEGAKAAREYYDWLEHDLNYRKANESSEYWANEAQEHPGAASVASVGLNLASGAGIVNLIAQNVKKSVTGSNEPIDYNVPALSLSKVSTEIRSTVADELSKRENGAVKSFLYQTGMSMADSGVVAALGFVGVPAAAALLGGSAATSAALEARERGASDGRALMSGIAAGIAETLFEELSLEKLIHPKSVSGLKDVVSNVLRQSFTEGSEEFFTTLANTVTDAFINGDRSEINSRIAELMQERDENGNPVYEAEEAEEIAWKEWLTNLGADFLGGAVSGGVMGGGASTINYAATRLDPVIRNERTLGKNLKAAGITNEQIKGMVAQAWIRTLGNEATSAYFDALSQRIAQGEDLTQMNEAELGALYELYTDVTGGQISREEYQEKVRRITEARAADEETLTLPAVDETQPETPVQAPSVLPAETVSEAAPVSPLASGALSDAVNRVRNGESLSGNDARRIMADESAMQELQNTGLLDAVRPGAEGRRQVLDAVSRLAQTEAPNAETIMRDPETAENPGEAPEKLTPKTTDAGMPENLTLPEIQEAQTAGSTREEAVRQLSRRIKAGESISEEEIARTLNGELTQTGGNGTMEAPIITEGVENNGRTETSGNTAGENGGNVGDRSGAYRRSERQNRMGSGGQNSEALLESLRRTWQQRAKQRSIRYLVKDIQLEKVNTRSIGVEGGTENETLSVIPDAPMDEKTEKLLEEIGFRRAQRSFAREGITVRGFFGKLEFSDESGVHTARGWTSPDGKTVYVALDHATLGYEQILLHEYFHTLVKRNPGLLGEAAAKFDEQYTETERRAIVNDYYDAYGFYDLSEDYVLEEVLADYYAGIDVFAGGEDAQSDLGKRQASVMRAVREAAKNGQERTEADTGGQAFSRDYSEAIDLLDKEELRRSKDTHIQVLDHTPKIYIEKAGAKNRRILISWESAYLAMKKNGSQPGNYHNLGSKLMKMLPQKIADPEYITITPKGRINAILEMRKGSRPILVSVEMDTFLTTVQENKSDDDTYNLVLTVMDPRENYLRNNVFKNNTIKYSKYNEDPANFISRLRLSQNATMPANDLARSSDSNDSMDGEKVKGKFSMEMPAEETDRLVALHNISESGLLSALELGGLAMPSFAVMRAGTIQNGYGDITIVAGKDSIDPKIKNQSIFGGDAWTPTFPEISYKISKTEQNRIVKRIESLLGSDVKILGGTVTITDDNLSRAIQNADGDFAKAVKNNRVMQVAFLRDSGESLEIPRLAPYSKYGLTAEDYQAILDAFGGELPRGYDAEMSQEEKLRNLLRERTLNAGTDRETAREIADALYSEGLSFSGVDDIFGNTRKFQRGEGRPDTKRIDAEIKATMEGREAEYADWLNELGRGIVEKKGIYNNKDTFTASGNRRSWDALHYDFTLANIVKAMQKQPKQGDGGFMTGAAAVKGAALKEYRTVEDVRADLERLDTDRNSDAFIEFGDHVRDVAYRISDDISDGARDLSDILSHAKTKTAIYRYLMKEYDYLEERGLDLESLAEDIAELGKEANALPMEYFEAKVYRAFPANEALAYVVPDDASRKLIEGLEAQGLNVLTYEAGNEADRLAKINSVDDARFSRNLPGETAELQDEYDKLKEKLDYWKGQVKRTELFTLREADTKRLTRSILSDYSSKADAENIGQRMKTLGEYLMNGDEGGVRWVDAHDGAVRIARDVIREANALVDDGERETYRRMKAYFHGKSIRVTGAKENIPDYNDFRKRNFGKFILSDNGTLIDTLWEELQEEFGKGYFPEEVMTQEDMIYHVSDLLDAMRDTYENPYQSYYAEAVEYCANDILDRLLSDEVRQTPPTFADKAEARLARQSIRYENKLEEQAERFEERYQKRVLKDEERYQRVRYLLDQERENRKAQLETLRRKHRSKEAKARETRKAAALRKKITSHARELTSLLLKPSDKRHIPKGLEKPVAALLSAIDLSSGYVLEFGRDGKYHRVDPTLTIGGEETQRTEAFRRIQEQLRQMSGEWTDDGTLFGDTETPGLFTTVIEDYADTPIANMNSEQLQTVWDALRTIEGAIRSMNRLFSTTRWQNQAELAADIRKQNAGKTKPKEYRGFFGKVQNTAVIDAMTPEAYFHRLGAVGDEMFRLARDAQDRNIRIIEEAQQKTAEIVGDTDYRKLEREMHTVTFGGEPVQISTAQLMELYALSRRDQGLQHILTGGILIEETKKGLVRNISVEPVRATPAELSEAISMLTAEQRRMTELMQDYLSVDMAMVGNEAALQVYNYEKFGKEEIYWPIRTNRNEVRTEVGDERKVTTPAQRGFTKAVKPNAKTSLKVGSIFDTYSKHISDMANYAAWLGFTEDMNRVRNFNFKDENGVSTGTIKGILNTVYGSGGAAYLENLLADISNGAGVDDSAMTSGLVGNYKAAAIGANLRVILQQPTAILRAADMINPKYLAAGLANPFKGFEEAKKYAPIAVWKDWGYFDINTGRQMKDVLFDNTDKLAKAKELSMALAGKADSFAWGQLWNACKAEVADKTDLSAGTQEFYDAVAKRFTEIIDHTQVVDGILQRSQAMRSKSWLMKTATSFMAEPTKQYNMFLSAVYDAKHGDDKAKKKLARTVAALLISGVVNSAVQSIWDAVRDDDKDKEYWEKSLSAFIGYDPESDTFWKGLKSYFDSNVGTMLNPGSYLPFFKDAVSLLQGYDVSRMDMDAIDGTITAAQSWVKAVSGEGKKTTGYTTMRLIENAAKLLGVPLYNIERDLTAITDTIATATKSYPLQYRMYSAINRTPDSGKPNADVTAMLYNAYMADNGDYEQITRMMEKDGYDAEEIRKAVEAKWKSERGITDALKAANTDGGGYNLLNIVTAVDSLELPTADADLVLSMELGDKQREKYTAARKSGITPETYMDAVLTLPKFDLNSNGSYSGDEVEAALKSMKGLNDEKRAVLWQTLSDAKTAANNPFDADAGMEFLITSASVDIPELVLPTADGDATDFSKELSKAKKLSDKERLAAIGEIIGTEMKTESGEPSQYAKLIDCLDKGCSFDEWSRLSQYGYGVDQYLKLRKSGVSHSGSMSLTETIKNLSPAAGKSSVSDEQKINSVVGTKLSDKEKLSAIGTIIGTDMTTDSGNPTQWAKLNTAVNDGVSVDDAIRMAQNDTLNVYIRWRDSAARKSGVKSDVYISYRSETAKMSADKGADGKSISGSEREKVLKYINSLKLTAAQKDALYYDAGYAESKIDDAPWHGLQLPTE